MTGSKTHPPVPGHAAPQRGMAEFVALVATMSGLAAFTIDAMLPALRSMGRDLAVANTNDRQLIIGLYFAGLASGPLLFGPLSDSIGRKRSIYAGLVLYLAGTALCLLTHSFYVLLAGRILQGAGAAGPRVVSVAMVRDCFSGDRMARVMSFVMAVFIFIPAVAPTVGQVVVNLSHWRGLFVVFGLLGIGVLIWFARRQKETLPEHKRKAYSLANLRQSGLTVLTNPICLSYTVAIGFLFGCFLGYLSSAQQIFQDTYLIGELFPLYFALLAVAFGLGSLLNTRLVLIYGMHRVSIRAIALLVALGTIFYLVALSYNGIPPFILFMLFSSACLMAMAVAYGNLNAMAMEPLGDVAGIGAAFISAFSVFISLPLGITIGRLYDGAVTPLAGGYAVLGVGTLLALVLGRYLELRAPSN